MNEQDFARLRFNLVSAVTDYDQKQSTKPSYNIYALPQYLERVNDIMEDIAAGADPRSAIAAGFTDRLLSFVMRKMKLDAPTREEIVGLGSAVYTPVAKKNPLKRRKGESVRDFTSRCMSEEKTSFPEPKQRIAVCLSKSRKRNPVYDTGSDE